MTIDNYFQEIESLKFQIQFSVLSGLEILLMTLSHHQTVNGLISLAQDNSDYIQQIYQRIRYLLPLVDAETEVSYDESIVTYLFCLSRIDILLAQQATIIIARQNGLWWSSRLAFHLNDSMRIVLKSIDITATSESLVDASTDLTQLNNSSGTAHSLVRDTANDTNNYPFVLPKIS